MSWQDEMNTLAESVVETFDVSAATVVVRRVTLGAFDAATQTRASTTISGTVRASRSARRIGMAALGGDGSVHVAETEFLVCAADLALTDWAGAEPKEGDQVVVGSSVFPIVRVMRELDGAMLKLVCRDTA